MARQALINTADDMRWLREVHLPSLPPKYQSATIVGNEDYPERIEVYESRAPRVTDVPLVFEADAAGIFKPKSKAQHHAKKKPTKSAKKSRKSAKTSSRQSPKKPSTAAQLRQERARARSARLDGSPITLEQRRADSYNSGASWETKPKTAAQLDREIAEVLAKPSSPKRTDTSDASAAKRSHATIRGARKLGSIGDVNPIDYGGGYIFSTPESGGPHLEYFEGLDSDERASRLFDDDEIDALKVELYRVDLGKDAEDFLSDHDWIDWKDIARTTGQDISEYAPGKLRSAHARARAAEDAASYHGWANFDSYPLQLTVGELKERWGK